MNPMGFAASVTGLPVGKKKPTHRGRKPSGKPGAEHLAALQAAHGKGDHKSAKTAALSYANAIHKFTKAPVDDGDGDEMGMGMGQPSTPPSAKVAAPPAQNNRAMLAKLSMSRKK